MTLDSMFCKARFYESAQKHSENHLTSQYQSHNSSSSFPLNDNKLTFTFIYSSKTEQSNLLFLWQQSSSKIKVPCS